jgi:hypothetical protein
MIGYIDPASGSMIWQGIVAAVLGAGVALKVFWRRIIGFFRGKNRGAEAQANGSPAATTEDARGASTASAISVQASTPPHAPDGDGEGDHGAEAAPLASAQQEKAERTE